MKIRKAKKSDYDQLMIIYDIFVGEERYSKYDQDSFNKVLALPTSFVYVVEIESRIIGFVAASVKTLVRYPKPIIEIDELFVSEEFREKGIGKKLIERIERIGKKKDYYRIYIASAFRYEIAHKFYEGLGYTKYGYHFYKNL